MSMHAHTSATKQSNDVFSTSEEGKEGSERTNTSTLDATIPFHQTCFIRRVTRFAGFMLLFGSHGATHPTQEWRSSGSAGEMQKQKAPAGLGFAAVAPDEVGVCLSTGDRPRGWGRVVFS